MKYLDYTGLQYFWSKLKALFQTKQDVLVSGTNIKTINGSSILGSGDIQAGEPNAVKYVPQSLTDAQKVQARENIGAGIGISTVSQTTTSTESDGINVITVTKDDGTQSTFQVRNGSQGANGTPGITAANVSVATSTGTPAVTASITGTTLNLSFSGLKGETGTAGANGAQGNSGYSGAAGELEVVNNLTSGGATSALSAEMGKQLNESDEMKLARSIEGIVVPSPTILTGGHYNHNGVFTSNSSSRYTNLEKIPYGAQSVFYKGWSVGSADGAIVWYDANKQYLSYFNLGAEGTAEVTIPANAVYYKASSFQSGLTITFVDGLYLSDEIKKVGEVTPLKNLINSIIAGNFVKKSTNVTIPSVATGTTLLGSASTNLWLQRMDNSWPISVTSLKFRAQRAASSFTVFIVDQVDITEKKARLIKKYTISESVVSGDNTIDVSAYGIVIPANGAIHVSSANYYGSGTSDGKRRMISIHPKSAYYTMSSLSANFINNYNINLSVIGVENGYDVSVPASALAVATSGNILFGKSYVAIGDSFTDPIGLGENIASGPYAGYAKTYSYIIGNRNYMSVLNQGSSGSTLNRYIKDGTFSNIPSGVDYITIWYGINDRNAGISIGDITDMPSSQISTETGTSTCGAFNWLFKWLYTNRPQAKIGVIVTDYCEQARRQAIISVCQRWGVAYLDLYDPTIPMIKTRGGQVSVCQEALTLRAAWADKASGNIHPSPACHEWQSTIIENFMRGL